MMTASTVQAPSVVVVVNGTGTSWSDMLPESVALDLSVYFPEPSPPVAAPMRARAPRQRPRLMRRPHHVALRAYGGR